MKHKYTILGMVTFFSLALANDELLEHTPPPPNYLNQIQNMQDKQQNDGTNFILSITPSIVQPTFSIPYFADIAANIIEQDKFLFGEGQFKKERLPAKYQPGIMGQLSYLLPTNSYLDLCYNYYNISSTGADHVNQEDFNLPETSHFGYGVKASLKGQYHLGEFYFTTRLNLLNMLDQYFHNDLSLGFSFQNLNLHYINNFKLNTKDGEGKENRGSLAQKQKHKIFGFGPAFKWLSTLDLLPMHQRPHNLSFVSEAKFGLLFSKYHAKGKANLDLFNIDFFDKNMDATDLNLTWRRLTDYFVTLNTTLKAGLKYSYKNFSIEGAYKILYFSDENYSSSDFFKGTLAEGISPDLTDFFNVFPVHIGFRALEFSLNWKF